MPKMITWIDRTFYSIAHDCDVARVSGFDDKHLEYWIEIPTGKGYAKRREEALLKIHGIDRGWRSTRRSEMYYYIKVRLSEAERIDLWAGATKRIRILKCH